MDSTKQVNRREFLGTAGAAAIGVAALAKPSVASTAANDTIVTATIGVGGQGGSHVNGMLGMTGVKVAAVCDVWSQRRDYWVNRAGVAAYRDYREVLDRKDIDAVTIGTPDHWHAKISIDAMEAGKHVYCEKPMTLTWQEAKDVAAAARRTGRVYQCGAQSASDDRWWLARRLIEQGAIGKVIWSQAGYCRNDPRGDWNWVIDPRANPGNLDWALWLGPAPKRPWSPERYFRFRKFWDYSGGLATDLLYHALAHLAVALNFEFPVEVSAVGGNYVHAEREVPDTLHMLIKYPSNHTVFLASTQENHDSPRDEILGQLGTMSFDSGIMIRPQARPPERWKSGVLAAGEVRTDDEGKFEGVTFGARRRSGHMENFFNAVRGRETCTLDADAAYRVMVAIHLGVLSYRLGKTMRFDPVREEVIG